MARRGLLPLLLLLMSRCLLPQCLLPLMCRLLHLLMTLCLLPLVRGRPQLRLLGREHLRPTRRTVRGRLLLLLMARLLVRMLMHLW
jgi:hypothetical protein